MNCPRCWAEWKKPQLLSCGHSLCLDCIPQISNSEGVQCSQCFQLSTSIQTNFALIKAMESLDREDVCIFHGLDVICYTKTPHSLLCSQCVKEVSEIETFPLPYVEKRVNRMVSRSLKRLKKKSNNLESMIELINQCSNEDDIDKFFNEIQNQIDRFHQLNKKNIKLMIDTTLHNQNKIGNILKKTDKEIARYIGQKEELDKINDLPNNPMGKYRELENNIKNRIDKAYVIESGTPLSTKVLSNKS